MRKLVEVFKIVPEIILLAVITGGLISWYLFTFSLILS